MNALIRKEIRLILPAGLAAVMLAAAPVWLISVENLASWRNDAPATVSCFFALGSILLGLAPFGQECSLGTFSLLLSQPVIRRRIWRAKLRVVAVALVSVFAALLLSFQIRIQAVPSGEVLSEMLAICGLSALAAGAGGLWTTLLFRQVAAGLWFTLLVPLVILTATAMILGKLSENVAIAGVSAVLVIYSIAGFCWARRMFLHAQDTSWTGGTLSLPAWLGSGAGTVRAAGAPKRRPLRALLGKEFQLHQVSLLIGAGLFLFHLAVIGVRRMVFEPSHQNDALSTLLEFWWVLWLGLPFLVGSTAVAEERKLGTLEGQLCLPATRRAQFAVKLALALLLGVFLGGLMPWLAEGIGGWDVVPGSYRGVGREAVSIGKPLALTCLVSAGIALVSFYASTLVRALLQAMGTAIAVGFTLMGTAVWANNAAIYSHHPPPWGISLVSYIGLPVILAALIWLAFINFKQALIGWNIWLRNLLAMLISLASALTVSATIYHRLWELPMTLEPRHGPVQLSGPVGPKICSSAGRKLFVLLPDGRLWAAGRYELKEIDRYVEVRHVREGTTTTTREKAHLPVPVDGVFLGLSNWVDLASTHDQAIALQSDGSLWRVFSKPEPFRWIPKDLSVRPELERIGNDLDWKSVAAGGRHFLALKKDGTLWGWGNNQDGQLGVGLGEFSNEPVRIGADSDWAAVFAEYSVSIGIKRDGSVWKWGRLDFGPKGWEGWKMGPHPEPVRWNLDGSGWRSLSAGGGFNLVLQQDGSLWATGNLPQNLFGRRSDRRFTPIPVRLDRSSDWADVAARYNSLIAVRRDGTLFLNDLYAGSVFWRGNLRRPSKYSDWIAVAVSSWEEVVALAADGTLCVWGEPFNTHSLLGPTRKPLWSLNIFAQSNSSENAK